jgi:5-methylcytosine-specific restriction protein B
MNTSDRSLAGLDIALRRRFTFKEMPPKPELLDGVEIEGINIGELLAVMNQRIEVLLGRDYCLGHAYFMSLTNQSSITDLAAIFQKQIFPLLQEYFFEDWQRIQWVLNDHRKTTNQFVTRQTINDLNDLFGGDVTISDHQLPWVINKDAFVSADAYQGIIKAVNP